MMDRSAFFATLRSDSGMFGSRLTQRQVDGIEAILDLCERAGADLGQTAYILGTGYGESGGKMQPVRENTRYTDPAYIERTFSPYRRQGKSGAQLANRPELLANTVYGGPWGEKNLGNTVYGDGYNLRGAGIGQITGRRNFEKWGRKFGVDLVKNPGWLDDLGNSAKALVTPMLEGWATGKRLDQFVKGDRRDYLGARAVWGGVHPEKYVGYAKSFERALKAGGYGAMPEVKPDAKPEARPAGNWLANLIAALSRIFGKGKT